MQYFDRIGLLSNLKLSADFSKFIESGDLTLNQLISVEKIIKERVISISK